MAVNSKRIGFIILLSIVLLTSCAGRTSQPEAPSTSPSQKSANCRVIQHDRGATEICGQPQTIAVLGTNMLELLLALEVQPAGYAEPFPQHRGRFDRPSQQIPYLGDRITTQPEHLGTWDSPSLEAITALNPDLILGTVELNADEYATLSQIAPTLLFQRWKPWQETILPLATAVNRAQVAPSLIQANQQALNTAQKRLAPVVASHPQVLLLVSEHLVQTLEVANAEDGCGKLLVDLGFQLVLPPAGVRPSPYQAISLEVLPKLESDLILVQGHNIEALQKPGSSEQLISNQIATLRQEWQTHPVTQSLKASQRGQVYFIPTYLCRALPGPIGTARILDQLQTLLLFSQ